MTAGTQSDATGIPELRHCRNNSCPIGFTDANQPPWTRQELPSRGDGPDPAVRCTSWFRTPVRSPAHRASPQQGQTAPSSGQTGSEEAFAVDADPPEGG